MCIYIYVHITIERNIYIYIYIHTYAESRADKEQGSKREETTEKQKGREINK